MQRPEGETVVDVEAVGLEVVLKCSVSVSSVSGEEVTGGLCMLYVGTEVLFFGHWGPLESLME